MSRGLGRGNDLVQRRALLGGAAVAVLGPVGLAKAEPASSRRQERAGKGGSERQGPEAHHEENVTPAEDLMREHGLLNRLLLVYEEALRRGEGKDAAAFPVQSVASAAEIIRRFIEQYHEKLEEEHLFPRFEKAGKLVDLVGTLRRQHQAGRRLTETILGLAKPATATATTARQTLTGSMRSFIAMYRPHEAREDTVLFPALAGLVSRKELTALGEAFEEEEHARFGKQGFEGVVAEVAKLEEALGIHDLDRFTPPSP